MGTCTGMLARQSVGAAGIGGKRMSDRQGHNLRYTKPPVHGPRLQAKPLQTRKRLGLLAVLVNRFKHDMRNKTGL